ncbi:hypothetical protein LJR131_001085 [Polaromonas sp. LjRoot131]
MSVAGGEARRCAHCFDGHRTRPFAADVNFLEGDKHAFARLQAAAQIPQMKKDVRA